MTEILDRGHGNILTHRETAILLALLSAAEQTLHLDHLVHMLVVVTQTREELAAAESTSDERLQMDSNGLALDDVVPPPIVLQANQHTSDGSLDADHVGRDKVELLFCSWCLRRARAARAKDWSPPTAALTSTFCNAERILI